MRLGFLATIVLASTSVSVAAVEQALPAEHAAWRAERAAKLTAPDGWLSLIGLHFLNPGASRVGRAKDNDIVLAAGPAHVGVVSLDEAGRVSLALADGVSALVDGAAVRTAELKIAEGPAKPTTVTLGTVSFFAIERGGKKALRVRDSASPRRAQFAGLDYFPFDPAWRIEARWEAFEKSRLLLVANVLGQVTPMPVPGRAIFERDGRSYELLAIDEGPGLPLFFVISDATTGNETYGAARFVYAEQPKDGKIVLDFNRAENPPCAFTPFATCPLPPKENRLTFAVRAGEKNYRGAHE